MTIDRSPLTRTVQRSGSTAPGGVRGAGEILFHLADRFGRRRRTTWGATPDEAIAILPGDDLMPDYSWDYTHAITIAAPPALVWPWLAQLGQGRAGLYSFEFLENLVGCNIHGSDVIQPELQNLAVGDPIRLHPKSPPLVAAMVEPDRCLVLVGTGPSPTALWAFHLSDAGGGTTRLVERGRYLGGPSLASRVMLGPAILEPISFVMSRQMLRTIKRLAEHAATTDRGDPVGVPLPVFLPSNTATVWHRLGSPANTREDRFDPDEVDPLPDAVSRWLRHVIEPGTPLRGGVTVAMHGKIRIGRWQPFTAQQIVSPSGYIWAADAGRFPIRIRGFDRFSDGTGEMQWRLLGRIPVVAASGPDVSRSAAGRHASELIGLTPGGALDPAVVWHEVDDHRATATVTIGAFVHHVTIDVDDRGRLHSVALPRWGNPDKGSFAEHTFGVECEGETSFDGYTRPATIRAGWWFGTERWTDGEFFRCTIDRAEFR